VLELRHLRYFVAVAEELNFSRAAERLHMAQPPLSVAIRQLEQEVGAELLARSTREVRLTSAGGVLLEGARRLLDGLEGTLAATRRAADGQLGTLRVGFSWSARFSTLPVLGQALARSSPDVTLITQEMWNARMPQALQSANIDVAISLCPELDSELAYEPVRRERVAALLPEGHPRASAPEVELSALAKDTFLIFPRELAPRLHDAMLAICRGAGFEPKLSKRPFHSAGDTGTLSAGDSVALAPESVRGALPGVVAVALAGAGRWLDTYMLWNERTAPPAAERLRDVARRAFADEPQRPPDLAP